MRRKLDAIRPWERSNVPGQTWSNRSLKQFCTTTQEWFATELRKQLWAKQKHPFETALPIFCRNCQLHRQAGWFCSICASFIEKTCPKYEGAWNSKKSASPHTHESFVGYVPRSTIIKVRGMYCILNQNTRRSNSYRPPCHSVINASNLDKNDHVTGQLGSSNGESHPFGCIIHWYILLLICLPLQHQTWLQNIIALVFSSQNCWLCIPSCNCFV